LLKRLSADPGSIEHDGPAHDHRFGQTRSIALTTARYFVQPGKNSLSLKQLAGLPKNPGVAEAMIKALGNNLRNWNDFDCS
jgi:hypothetical protein